MNPQLACDMIARGALLAGMRGHFPPEIALPLVEVLVDEGICALEFTMNSTRPLEALQAAKKAFGDRIVAGMGTILDPDTAKRALDAGADFVIAPSFQRATVEAVHAAGALMIPGVITPTEAVDAWQMGCRMLKIFPIGSLGLDYFKAVRAPLNQIPFLCNGGMTDKTIADYLRAGAVGCGLLGYLTGDGTWPLDKVRERARLLVGIVAAVRAEKPPQQD